MEPRKETQISVTPLLDLNLKRIFIKSHVLNMIRHGFLGINNEFLSCVNNKFIFMEIVDVFKFLLINK